MKLEFSRTDFREKKSYNIKDMKIRIVGTEFFRADGQTDMTKLIVAFRISANAPNKVSH